MLFLTVALVHLIALMSPGPDFFFVSQTAASRSHREAMMAVVGISLGIMVWAGVALMGLHLILQKMAWLHQVIMVGVAASICAGWAVNCCVRRGHRTCSQHRRRKCRWPGAAFSVVC